MDNSIPQNLAQCAFNFDTLTDQSTDSIPLKKCFKCEQWFSTTKQFFQSNKSAKDGFRSCCKNCTPSQSKFQSYRNIPEGKKRCWQCKEFKPATTEFFHISRTKKSGLQDRCLACTTKPKPPEGYKHCTGCDRDLPATHDHFGTDKRKKDQLRQPCHECRSRNGKQDRQENLQNRLEYERKWRETHQEQVKASNTKYMRSDKGQEASRVRQHNRRARVGSIPGMHTREQIQDQLKRQKYKCYYCSEKFKKLKDRYDFHIEHTFPVSRVVGTDIPANDISYLVLACPVCNRNKGDKFPWEFPEGGRLI